MRNRTQSGLIVVVTTLSTFTIIRTGLASTAGALDSTFSVGSDDWGVNTVLLQPDGKMIIAGTFSAYHNMLCQGIARLNSDASFDPSFDAKGVTSGGNGLNAGYLYPDGKVLVAGGFYGVGPTRIARLSNTGALDASFDPGSGPNGDIRCLVVQPDGKIIIGGTFSVVGGNLRSNLARLNDDGSLDTNFVATADNAVEALALQSDGKIVVAGWFSHLNGTSSPFFARLNATGSVDGSFSTSVSQPAECILIQQDGNIVVGSSFNIAPTGPLGRVFPNGSWDPGFSVSLGPWVTALGLQGDGRILIGGNFATVNGSSRPWIARVYSDGSTDLSFNATPDNMVKFLVIQPDAKIVIAGGFGSVQGVTESGLARLYGDDSAASPVVLLNGSSFKAKQSDTAINIPVFRTGDTNVTASVQYATSDLDAEAGADYVATSGTLTFLPAEITKQITVPLLNDGKVDSSESFKITLSNPSGCALSINATGVVTVLGVNNVVQIDTPDIVTNELAGAVKITLTRTGTNYTSTVLCQAKNGTATAGVNFSNLAQTVTFAPGQSTNTATATLIDDDQPGPDTSFTVQLSNPVNATIGVRSNMSISILENDAAGHPAFGLTGPVSGLAASADGGVFVGGGFISINGTPRNRIGKINPDGSVDQAFAPAGADNVVSTLLVEPGGKIVCGGSFTSGNGISRVRIMRLNADGSLDPSFDPGVGADYSVVALVPCSDGGYFAAGFFGTYNGVPRRGVVRINPNGSVNTNFVPQIPLSVSYVFCLGAQSGGRVLVGTSGMLTAGSDMCFRLKADGSRDSTFTNQIPTSFPKIVYTLAPQPDGKIVVGGIFGRTSIMRLNSNGSADGSFNVGDGVSSGGTVEKLLLLPNGQLIAAGYFSTYAGVARNSIVRLNSDGSLDRSFDPGPGPNRIIYDVALLSGGRYAVGGSFTQFGGFPRRYFAILDASGQLITQIECESFAADGDLKIGLKIEPDKPFELLQSFDLQNWLPVYSDVLHLSFTNLTVPRPASDKAFFRVFQPQ